jgi:hypothetical protein
MCLRCSFDHMQQPKENRGNKSLVFTTQRITQCRDFVLFFSIKNAENIVSQSVIIFVPCRLLLSHSGPPSVAAPAEWHLRRAPIVHLLRRAISHRLVRHRHAVAAGLCESLRGRRGQLWQQYERQWWQARCVAEMRGGNNVSGIIMQHFSKHNKVFGSPIRDIFTFLFLMKTL